jgi:hypothetical protein
LRAQSPKAVNEDLCPGGGEELSLLDRGRNAGVGTSCRHRTKKGAEPIREKDCLSLDYVHLDVARVCIGVFCPMHSSLVVATRPRKRGGDAIDGIIELRDIQNNDVVAITV